MDSSKDPPLDEIQWKSPETVMELGGIHTNTGRSFVSSVSPTLTLEYVVLYYFARSPFFDATSNNATLFTQAMYNQNLTYILGTRVQFEERLRSMQGLEFMVTHDPSEGDKKMIHSGVWVIRKQNRRKRPGLADEVTGLASYYVVNDDIYMAPSVSSVITSRLLSAVTSLNNFLSTVSTLPDFTPSLGHTYLPYTAGKHPTPSASFQTAATTKENTPMPNAGTPRPDTQETITSKISTAHKHATEDNPQDLRMLAESWDLSIRYGNDFMDENPLVGEPGNFKLTNKTNLALASSFSNVTSGTPQPFKASVKKVPPPLDTSVSAGTDRRKSTPGTAKASVTPGGKDKKARRKSKAAGVATPKSATSA